MKNLQGKTALVTGAGRGIGRAVAIRLAMEGANVIVNDADEIPAVDTAAHIRKMNGNALVCHGDILQDGFPEHLVDTALQNYGDIHIIVNNAGYTLDAMLHQSTDYQLDAMLNIHIKAPLKILRAAAPHIREAGRKEAENGIEIFRKVVNISSIAGVSGNIGQICYSSAKSGLTGMTKTLAKEWGRFKVNVNCVAFGWIDTRLTALPGDSPIKAGDIDIIPGIPQKNRELFLKLIPIGRPGTTEEAASAVYMFCSPDSNYISGQVITVSGGLQL